MKKIIPIFTIVLLSFYLVFVSGCANKKSAAKIAEQSKNNAVLVKKHDSVWALNKQQQFEIQTMDENIKRLRHLIADDKLMGSPSDSADNEGSNHSNSGENSNGGGRNPASVVEPETITKIKVVTIKGKSTTEIDVLKNILGNISFFCEKQMRASQTYEVNAMLSPLFNNQEIREELLKTINESRKENGKDLVKMENIISREINLGHYLKIELKDPANKFKIETIHQSDTQQIFDTVTNKYSHESFDWKWFVTPNETSTGNAKLELIITPIDKNGKEKKFKTKTYDIKIQFKQPFLNSVWEEMNKNVKWAIASIIAPLLTFFAGRYFKNTKNNETA